MKSRRRWAGHAAFMEAMRSSHTVLIWSNHSGDFGVVKNICNKLSENMVQGLCVGSSGRLD
jgi:hypothetical protein